MSSNMDRADKLTWGSQKLTLVWPRKQTVHDPAPKLIVRSQGSFSWTTKRSDDAGTP